MSEKTFSIDELCALTELSKRTVRYYMQIELVDRAVGETRAAYYTERHLQQLLRIRELTQAGLSLEGVREVLQGGDSPVPARRRTAGAIEVRSHLFIAPGLELQIAPDEAQLSPDQIRRLAREVASAWKRIKGSSDE